MTRLPRLIVRSVVGRNDRSHDAMIYHAIDRCTPRLIYDRPSGATIDRTLCHRMHECSYDRSHAGCHDCSYDRSQDATIDRIPPVAGRHD